MSGAVARAANAPLELLVHVFDPADLGAQPNGKQRISAIDNPGGDTYTPASGIWQTVWLEEVPATYVSRVVVGADATTLSAKAIVNNCPEEEGTVRFEILDVDGTTLASADADVDSGEASTSIAVPSPRLWSPSSPRLYDLRLTVSTGLGPTDTVLAYFGMRTFALANVTAPPVPMSGRAPASTFTAATCQTCQSSLRRPTRRNAGRSATRRRSARRGRTRCPA